MMRCFNVQLRRIFLQSIYLKWMANIYCVCVLCSIYVCLNRLMSYSCNPCTALLFCQQSATFVMKSFYCDSTGFCVPHDCCFYLLFAQRFSSFSGRFLPWCTLRIGWRPMILTVGIVCSVSVTCLWSRLDLQRIYRNLKVRHHFHHTSKEHNELYAIIWY